MLKTLLFLNLFVATIAFAQNLEIAYIPDPIFLNTLIDYGVDNNGDGKIQYTEAATVTKLYLAGLGIKTYAGLDAFVNLQLLECGGNPVTFLDISKNVKLEDLNCAGLQITVLDVTKNSKLSRLNCRGTALSKLDVSNNVALTALDCSELKLATLDFSKNKSLKRLLCNDNKLTSLDVSNNKELEALYCQHNSIPSLDVSETPLLYDLNCSDNPLGKIDVSRNPELITLECNQNNLSALDVTKNVKLNFLRCRSNPKLLFICVRSAQEAQAKWNSYKDPNAEWTEDCIITGFGEGNSENTRSLHHAQDGSYDLKLDKASSLIVYNMTGQVVESFPPSTNHHFGGNYQSGVYFIHIHSDDKHPLFKILKD